MTPEMRRTLTIVQEYYARHGVSPTMRELAALEGLNSVGGVHRRMKSLLMGGYLIRSHGRDRAYIPAETDLSKVPTQHLRAELQKRDANHG